MKLVEYSQDNYYGGESEPADIGTIKMGSELIDIELIEGVPGYENTVSRIRNEWGKGLRFTLDYALTGNHSDLDRHDDAYRFATLQIASDLDDTYHKGRLGSDKDILAEFVNSGHSILEEIQIRKQMRRMFDEDSNLRQEQGIDILETVPWMNIVHCVNREQNNFSVISKIRAKRDSKKLAMHPARYKYAKDNLDGVAEIFHDLVFKTSYTLNDVFN